MGPHAFGRRGEPLEGSLKGDLKVHLTFDSIQHFKAVGQKAKLKSYFRFVWLSVLLVLVLAFSSLPSSCLIGIFLAKPPSKSDFVWLLFFGDCVS